MVRAIAAAILLLSIAAPAGSDVIFSNLGPGGSYSCCTGWTVYGSAAPLDTDRASPFTPLATYRLDLIGLGVTWLNGTNAADVWLMSDINGLPGTVLESYHLTDLPTFQATSTDLASTTSTLHPLLTAGVQYWIAVSATDDAFLSFNLNTTGDEGLASRDNNGPWGGSASSFTAGAFEVSGAPIPEPATLILIGSGLVGSFWRRRKQRRT